MKLKNILIPFLALIFITLSGCFEELKDGYQLGDITNMTVKELKKLGQARVDYCAKTSDSFTKQAALLVIRAQLPAYPEDGVCIRAGERLKAKDERIEPQAQSNLIRDGPPDPLPA